MPYIKNMFRENIDRIVRTATIWISANGSLNYFLVKLMLARRKVEGNNYHFYKNWIGEIECHKMEVYRKYVAPYEKLKEKENGSIEEH